MLRTRAVLQAVCRRGWGSASRGISSSSQRCGLLDSIFGGSGTAASNSASSTGGARNESGDSSHSGSRSASAVTNARASDATPAEEAAIKTALATVVEPVTGKTLLQLGSLRRIVVSRDAHTGTLFCLHV